MDFTGKNVVVTGGASGIGKAIAAGIVKGGGHAIIVDLNLPAAQATVKELGNASAYQVDMGNSTSVREVFAKILSDLDQIHVLINNAGIVSTKPLKKSTRQNGIGWWRSTSQVFMLPSVPFILP